MNAARIAERLEPLEPRRVPGPVKVRAVGMLTTRTPAGRVTEWLAREGYWVRAAQLREWARLAGELRDQ